MSRPPAFLLWAATFASGISLGVILAHHRAPVVSAQETPPLQASSTKTPILKGDESTLYQEMADAYERFRDVDRAFELVAKVVSPSVVHLTAKKHGPRDDGNAGPYEETGSGVIVRSESAKGLYVLTNHHVVKGAANHEIRILLQDGRVLKPSTLWTDPKADIAVLKLDRDDLPSAHMGNSDDARVGSWVLALGSPFGLTHSVSQGIISARGRYEQELEIDGVDHQEFLQTDAAINPGNSGGPLVNMKGEIIGINTAIASEGGGSVGVGFSIPINLAHWAMNQLVAGGKVARGAMGVNLQELSPGKAIELGLAKPRGARIVAVHEGSPAASGGLGVGDVVLKFNGVEVVDNNHLINLVSMAPIGDAFDLVVWRDRKSITVKVTIADRDAILAKSPPERSEPVRERIPKPALGNVILVKELGLSLETLDASTRIKLFGDQPDLEGVIISKVEKNSPLAKHLQPMDVIESIRDKPIHTPDDVRKAIQQRGDASPIEVKVRRLVDHALVQMTVRIP